jgi:hypothetical protein
MDIQPIHNDYVTDSLEEIVNGEVFRLNNLLEGLKDSNRLCSNEGRQIVAEFGFKGNIKAVIYHLEDYIRDLQQNGITDLQRIEIQDRIMEATTLLSSEDEANPYIELFKQAVNDGDIEAMAKYGIAVNNYQDELHAKQECLCYMNEE